MSKKRKQDDREDANEIFNATLYDHNHNDNIKNIQGFEIKL